MIAFQVKLNGKRICIAGAPDLAVLTAHVTASGDIGPKTMKHCAPSVRYRVGGLTARANPDKDVHLVWTSSPSLKIGDVVEIKILEVPKADRPKSRSRAVRKCQP